MWPELKPKFKNCSDPSPGLFALREAENILALNRDNNDQGTEDSASTTVRNLRNITFRTLHFLVHASALVAVGLNWKRRTPLLSVGVLKVLSQHMGSIAGLRCASRPESTLWYLKGSVEADLRAIAALLHGFQDDAVRFIHAVLHRLLVADGEEIKRAVSLKSSESRGAYENWFQRAVIDPVLTMRKNNLQVPLAVVAWWK